MNGEVVQETDAKTAHAVLGQPATDASRDKQTTGSSDLGSWGKRLANFCHRKRRYSVVLGGIFVYLPIGVPWYYGNLATYLASYFRRQAGGGDEIVDPQWVFSAFFVAFSVAIVVSGYLANALGTRVTIAIALLVHGGATFASYFAVQNSMVALIITFGAVGGLGAGLAYGPPMPTISKWMPRNVGLASGVLLTGFGGGAVFYNELITFYINPDNVRPDVHTERTSYFSQSFILDRVPEIFLVLGGLTVILQVIGISLIRDPGHEDEVDGAEAAELKPTLSSKTPQATELKATPSKDTPLADASKTDCEKQEPDTKSEKSVSICEIKDMTPLEVLQKKEFYILWLALGMNHYAYIIKNNYYKEFGASRIDNDHLLTSIGTVSTIFVAISRLFWGMLADIVGIKMTIMLLLCGTTVLSAFWSWSLEVGPALYFTWIVVITFHLAGPFILFPLAALRSFGQTHYASNYGLITTVQIIINLISPPIIRVLLDKYSWFGVFCSTAVCNLLGTALVLLLPKM